jgi:hypothetical protein
MPLNSVVNVRKRNKYGAYGIVDMVTNVQEMSSFVFLEVVLVSFDDGVLIVPFDDRQIL